MSEIPGQVTLGIFGRANGTFGLVGGDATVILNANGQVVTTYATGAVGFRIPLPLVGGR
jgi:hypothetical protein